jgi:hypothetical protein
MRRQTTELPTSYTGISSLPGSDMNNLKGWLHIFIFISVFSTTTDIEKITLEIAALLVYCHVPANYPHHALSR